MTADQPQHPDLAWNETVVPTSAEHSRRCWHYITMGDGECDCGGPDRDRAHAMRPHPESSIRNPCPECGGRGWVYDGPLQDREGCVECVATGVELTNDEWELEHGLWLDQVLP